MKPESKKFRISSSATDIEYLPNESVKAEMEVFENFTLTFLRGIFLKDVTVPETFWPEISDKNPINTANDSRVNI